MGQRRLHRKLNPNYLAAGGLDQDGGPASLGNDRRGAGEPSPGLPLGCSSSIASMCSVPGTSCNSTAPPADLLPTSSLPAEYMEDRQRMTSSTAGSPSCPQQGRKLASSKESKGSPEAMGPRRRHWKPNSKYLEAMSQRRRHCSSTTERCTLLCSHH